MSTVPRMLLAATAFFWLTAAIPPSIIASTPAVTQCCRTFGGTAKCQLKTPRSCQQSGGIDKGPGTCSPNPCAATTTTSTSSTTITPPPTTSTTTSSTTTTMPTGPCQCGTPDPTRLQFTTAIGSGNCGVAAKSDGTTFRNLACGGLYTGGGAQIFALPVITPDMGTSIAKVASCASTSLTLAAASSGDTGSLRTCTQAGCLFGAPLPLPNTNAPALSSCVINSLATDLTGTADCASGAAALNAPIKGEIFITGDLLTDAAHPGIQPCPLCEAGICHGGPNDGMGCTPGDSAQNTAYPTSHDCPPPPDRDAMVILSGPALLTTGTMSKTAVNNTASGQVNVFCGFCRDINAAGSGCFEGDPVAPGCPRNADCTGAGASYRCCTGFGTGTCDQPSPKACTSNADCTDGSGTWPDCEQRTSGAFGPAGAGVRTITETGSPAGNMTDGAGHAATLASVFCIPPTFNATEDAGLDVPGPGAVTYPGTVQLLP